MQIKIILRNHITPVGMALSERQKRSAMKWTKENPCALLAGMKIGTIIMENNTEVPQKLKIVLCDAVRVGDGTPLQSSCLENPMDRGAWWAAVHGVARSRTRLSDFHFTFHFHALEKEMATHSSVLAWRIPGMGEPGGLLSLGSHRVRHD